MLLAGFISQGQTTYYVNSNGGDNDNDGLSPGTAWETIEEVNGNSYQPGDFILFKSGETFMGKLVPSSSGSSGKQITYGKYGGTAKPIINGSLYNACIEAKAGQEYLTFTDLELINSAELEDQSGADIIDNDPTKGAQYRRYGVWMSTVSNGTPVRSIILNNLEIHKIYPLSIQGSDYKGYGINFTGCGGADSFDGITITNCEIYDVPMQAIGVNKWCNPTDRHKNLIIRDNYIHNTGSSGIILFEVDGYVIERNTITWTGDWNYNPVAWYDGKMRNRGSGFWCVRTSDGLLQYNEFSHARGPADSCGAHIDIENDNVIIQYNLSYDNAGGFAEFMGANTNCAYRYNVSINDGWRVKKVGTVTQASNPEMFTERGSPNGQEGKAVWFSDYYGCSTCKVPSVGNAVHNNTIYTESYTGYWTSTPAPVHALVKVEEGSAENLVKNNIFYMAGGSTLSYEEEPGVGAGNIFRNNMYSDAGPPGGLFGHASDIDTADPLFVNAGSNNPDDYRIQVGSPAINAGHNIQDGATLDDYPGGAGGMDYWGNFVDNTSGSIDIGAHETDGCSTTTTYNGAWDNGFPNINDLVIIDADYTTADDGGSFTACQVIVSDGVTLTVSAGDYIDIDTNIIVKGTLDVEATGSVVQDDDDAVTSNQGTINVDVTTPNLASRDFMIMGSPMTQDMQSVVWANPFLVLEHDTGNFVPNEAVAAAFPGAENFADDDYNDWSAFTSRILPGEGYLVRPQAGFGQPGGVFNYTYSQGTLNNGVVNYEAEYNGTQNGSPNVVANPYASAISVNSLVTANSMIDAVYFWEHLQPPSTTIPGAGSMNFSMENISMRNATGGNAATITQGVNNGANSGVPNDFISTGQGFAFKASAAGTVEFNNSMRVTANNNTLRNPEAKDRIWIAIGTAEHNLYRTALIGFMDEATAGHDANYDAKRLATVLSIYSHLEDGSRQYGIQGREAFQAEIKVPMGFSSLIATPTTYKISIDNLEGANLENATVYLRDNLTQQVHNLSEGAYQFESNKGTFHNRFVLSFEVEEVLSVDELERSVGLYPNPTTGQLKIQSGFYTIAGVKVYDLQGRLVDLRSGTEQQQMQLDLSSLQPALYLVEVTTDHGTVTKRLMKQ